MVDTAVKDGKTLFDFMDDETILYFTSETHDYGLKSALADQLKKNNFKTRRVRL